MRITITQVGVMPVGITTMNHTVATASAVSLATWLGQAQVDGTHVSSGSSAFERAGVSSVCPVEGVKAVSAKAARVLGLKPGAFETPVLAIALGRVASLNSAGLDVRGYGDRRVAEQVPTQAKDRHADSTTTNGMSQIDPRDFRTPSPPG